MRAEWGDKQVGCCRIQNQKPLLQHVCAKEPSKWRRTCCRKLRPESSKKDLNAQMTGAVTDVTLSQLSLSIRQKSEFSGTKSRHQLPTTPRHGCSTSPYWPRKHNVQGIFKAKSLHETTTWTVYSCDIEIISKTRWSEPELGKLLRWPFRDSSGFLNLHGNSIVFSAGDLAAFEGLICWILLDLRYFWAKTGTNTILAAQPLYVSCAEKTAFVEQSWWPEMFGSMPVRSHGTSSSRLHPSQSPLSLSWLGEAKTA